MKKTKYDKVSLHIKPKDKIAIKKLCIDYDCTQYDLISALIKIVKDYKPELKESLK